MGQLIKGRMTYKADNGHNYTAINEDEVTVIVRGRYAGEEVEGIAKCSPEDEFDLAYGIALAQRRCDAKIAKKRFKNAQRAFNEAAEGYTKAKERYFRMAEYLADARREYRDRCKAD